MNKDKEIPINDTIINEASIRNKIYNIRGKKVILDYELAEIYGYTTKAFNQQIKRNIERFPNDFMFQLSMDEVAELSRSQKVTLNTGKRGSNLKYAPRAFTESGIYMLMSVLKGELAVRQSIALIRTFRVMKNYIIENQDLIGRHEFTQLKLEVSHNREIELLSRAKLNEIDEQIKTVVDKMSDVVMRSEISPFLLDMGKPTEKHDFLILNGEPAKADETYINIYSEANKSVFIVDNYISIKTLRLLQDIKPNVTVTVFSDNLGNKLHASDLADFSTEFPHISINLHKIGGFIHDRYIILDFNTPEKRIYHCGASSKDAGKKLTSITEYRDESIKAAFYSVIEKLLQNPNLILK